MYKRLKKQLIKSWHKNKICTIAYILLIACSLWMIIPIYCIEYLAAFGDEKNMFNY
jgi:hypothetical protein